MEKRPLAVVIGIIRDNNGKILLQKRIDRIRADADGKWELPGGKIDFGESPEEALCREIKEEIGCEIELVRMMPAVRSAVWERTDGEKEHVLLFCYEAKVK